MHAITENPRLDRLEFAKRSANVLPTASNVHDRRVLLRSRLTDKNLITSTITLAEKPSQEIDPIKPKGVKIQLRISVLPSFYKR